MRAIVLLLCSLLIIPLSNSATVTKPSFSKHSVNSKDIRTLPNFNRVVVIGNLNVVLFTHTKPQVVVLGNSDQQSIVTTEVSSTGILYVKLVKNTNQSITVYIKTNHLNSFTYKGAGTIRASNLNSSLLNLIIENSGQTILNGSMNLQHLAVRGGGTVEINGVRSRSLDLEMYANPRIKLSGVISIPKISMMGDGSLELYWIKSENLRIRMKNNAYLQLAGITNRLDVEVWDKAHFNGRYLRAERAFVKTHDQSLAEISAVRHQHTLASDASDIYFYNAAGIQTNFMAFNGAVLDMR